MSACMLLQSNRLAPLVLPFTDYAHGFLNQTPSGSPITLFARNLTSEFDADNCGVDWSQQGPVLVYGSLDFIQACGKAPHLAQYVFNDRTAFSATTWEEKCGELMLNHDGCQMTVKELCEDWSLNDPLRQHIRPLSEDKEFQAKVFTWTEWFDYSQRMNLPDTLECWVSSDKGALKQEWRCWIIDGEVVSVVQYKANGEPRMTSEVPSNILSLANKIATQPDMWPAKLFVVDLCLNAEGEVKIVEFNPINSTGWYCPSKIEMIIDRWFAALAK